VLAASECHALESQGEKKPQERLQRHLRQIRWI
jgi:hypothetical protein